MIIVKLTGLDIPANVEHYATDYQIATDLLFRNIALESIEDRSNLHTIIYNDILDPGIKYYARARALLSTGYTIWGNIAVFTPKDVNEVELDMDMPSAIGVPVLSSSAKENIHPPTLFSLYAKGFSAIGNTKLESTSWLIEDLNGNVIWKKLYDKTNKEAITISDILLKNNNAYRARVIFNSTSRDSSQVATMTFKVGDNRYCNLITSLNNINVRENNKLRIAFKPGISHTEWEIINITDDIVTSIFRDLGSNDKYLETTIPANYLKANQIYIVKMKTNLDEIFSYVQFSTY